jgi:hypothetical protein
MTTTTATGRTVATSGAVRNGATLMAVAGLAVLLLAIYGVRSGQVWAWVAAVAAPVLGLAVALPAHYPWNLDTLGHLGLIYLATLVFVVGAVLSGKGLLDARRTTQSF